MSEHLGWGRKEFFTDNLLVRIRFIIEMIWWNGLSPWEFEFPFPGSLIFTILEHRHHTLQAILDANQAKLEVERMVHLGKGVSSR